MKRKKNKFFSPPLSSKHFLFFLFSKSSVIIFLIFLLPFIIWGLTQIQQIKSFGKTFNTNTEKINKFIPLSFSLSQSKLGVFYIGTTLGGKKILRAGPRVIKVLDPHNNPGLLNFIREYKRLYPQGIVVMRVYTAIRYNLENNPEESAENFWQQVLAPAVNKLSSEDRRLIDYLNGPNGYENTPALDELSSSWWYTRFWIRLAEIIAKNGFKPLVGEIYVGGLEDAHLDAFVPALKKTKEVGGAWSYHGYTIKYTKDEETESWYSLRYRRFYNFLKNHHPEVADLPMILGEGGVDYEGNPRTDGWQSRGSQAQYQDWLIWYDEELKKDTQIIGVTLFQIGGSGWPSFDLEPISDWLANYLSDQQVNVSPIVSPISPITLIPQISPSPFFVPSSPSPTFSFISTIPLATPTYFPTPTYKFPTITSPPNDYLPLLNTPTPFPTISPSPTPFPTPTFSAFFDMQKTLREIKNFWQFLFLNLANFTKTILP